MDAVGPGSVNRSLDSAIAAPHRAIAFEPASEADLPDAISPAHPPLRLYVIELVPERAARGVAKAVQRHAASFHVLRRELQALLQLVDHGTATGVDAEVLERLLEVRNIWSEPPVKYPPRYEREEEEQLFRSRKNERAQSRDIRLESFSRDSHEIFRKRDPHVPLGIFFLVDASVSLIVRAFVGPHDVH